MIEVLKQKKEVSLQTKSINTLELFKSGKDFVNHYFLESSSTFNINCSIDYYEEILKNKLTVIKSSQEDCLVELRKIVDGVPVVKYANISLGENSQNDKESIIKIKGDLFKVSNRELKLSNIIRKEDLEVEEIQNKFFEIISQMDCDETLKNILKGNLTKEKIKNSNTPILYFNEETNKREWVVPNFYSDEDFVFDYETEIPIFNKINGFYRYLNQEFCTFIVYKKEGIESYSGDKKSGKSIKYTNFDLPKNVLCMKSNRYDNHFYIHQKYLMDKKYSFDIMFPNISILEEEETLKLLEKIESNFTLKEIKKIIIETEKEPLIQQIKSFKNLNTIKNYLYVSTQLRNNIDFKKVGEENKEKDIAKLYLKEAYDKTNFYDFNLIVVTIDSSQLKEIKNIMKISFPDKISKSITTIKSKSQEEYLLLEHYGSKIILPKNKDLIPFNKDNVMVQCFNILNRETCLYIEKEMLVFSDLHLFDLTPSRNFILDIGKNISLSNNKYNKTSIGSKDEMMILHTEENELYLLDKNNKELKFVDTTKKLELLNYNVIKLLDFDIYKTPKNLSMYVTDNKILYFNNRMYLQHFPNNENNKKFNYYETQKTPDGNYQINLKMLMLKDEKDNFIYDDEINKSPNVFNYISNEKLELYVKNPPKNMEILEYTYEISENFIDNVDGMNVNNEDYNEAMLEFKKYLKNFQIKKLNLNLNEKDFYMFFNIFYNLRKGRFIINNKNNIPSIQISTEDQKKYIYIQDTKKNLTFFRDIKKDTGSLKLVKEIKSQKIEKCKEIKKYKIFFSKDVMYLDSQEEIQIVSYDYNNTLKNKESIINDDKSDFFCDKNNNIIKIIIDSSNVIKIENFTNKISKYNMLKDNDLSF